MCSGAFGAGPLAAVRAAVVALLGPSGTGLRADLFAKTYCVVHAAVKEQEGPAGRGELACLLTIRVPPRSSRALCLMALRLSLPLPGHGGAGWGEPPYGSRTVM